MTPTGERRMKMELKMIGNIEEIKFALLLSSLSGSKRYIINTLDKGNLIYGIRKQKLLPPPKNQNILLPRIVTFQEKMLLALQSSNKGEMMLPFFEAHKESFQMLESEKHTTLSQELTRRQRKYNCDSLKDINLTEKKVFTKKEYVLNKLKQFVELYVQREEFINPFKLQKLILKWSMDYEGYKHETD